MKNARTTYMTALTVTLVAAIAVSAIRTIALLVEFDPVSAYYDHGAKLPAAFMTIMLIAIAAACVFVYILRGKLDGVSAGSDSPAVIYVSALLGFVIVAGALLDFFIGGVRGGLISLSTLTLVLSVPAALYCLIGIALPIGNKGAETVLSVLMILWLFLMLVGVYFDTGVEINNPNKTLTLASLAVSLLFFVAEGRFRVGSQRPWRYVLSGFATVIVTGLYSIPNAALILMGAYPDAVNVTREMLILCIFIYAALRMILACGMVDDGTRE